MPPPAWCLASPLPAVPASYPRRRADQHLQFGRQPAGHPDPIRSTRVELTGGVIRYPIWATCLIDRDYSDAQRYGATLSYPYPELRGDVMDSESAALLSAAAATLVASMTTDGWEQVKAVFVRLWRRRPEHAEAVAADLAEARSDVVAARAAGNGRAEADLVTEWQSRLRRLVAGDEELQDDLRRFTEDFRHLLAGHGGPGLVVMRAEVHGPGRVNQVGRDQTVTGG